MSRPPGTTKVLTSRSISAGRSRGVDELGVHEVEAPRRSPVHDVADVEAVGPRRVSAAGQAHEGLGDVQAVGFDPPTLLLGPPGEALHEEPVGAADVEQAPVAVDRLDDGPAGSPPAGTIPGESRLPAGVVGGEVGPLQDATLPSVPGLRV
jgi:hypothetical protein